MPKNSLGVVSGTAERFRRSNVNRGDIRMRVNNWNQDNTKNMIVQNLFETRNCCRPILAIISNYTSKMHIAGCVTQLRTCLSVYACLCLKCTNLRLFRVRESVSNFYQQHCAQRKPSVFSLLRDWFWGFSPRGATRCTDGGEIWHRGGDRTFPPPCQIWPPQVQRQKCRTPKTEIFTPIWPKCGI